MQEAEVGTYSLCKGVLMDAHRSVNDGKMEFWGSLQVWSEDLGMFSKVEVECITSPSPDHLHGFKRNATKEVFQCGANTDSMPLEGLFPCCAKCLS